MSSARSSKRTLRARLKVDYKETSSSSDDTIPSLQSSPCRAAKRKREDSLRRSTPASLQTQNSSNSDDSTRVSLAQRGDSRRDSEASTCSLPSDIPIFSYLKKHRAREIPDSRSWSLPSDVPIFPYLRGKGLNAREAIAAQPTSLPPSVASVPRLDHPYLRSSETELCHEKEESKLDISLKPKSKVVVVTAEVERSVPDYVTPSVLQVYDPNPSHSIQAPSSTRFPTPKLPGSQSIDIKQKGNMAPGYRNRDRRQNRTGYVDHDVFEGLPVRHWRRDDVTVAPPPTQENTTSQNDIWAVELPHGMPKDSHLLPQHSQDLLRAARSGRIYKRPAPPEEEEADVEAVLGDKPEKKDDDTKDRGFTAKAWKQIPRHMEGPDVEYLAKRRKGLITVTAKTAAPAATLTKTTVKRIDAAGNEYVQDVVVPHGQKVEGEVISQTVIPDPSAAPVDPFAVQQPTPSRKKGSSKKKSKGAAGRGRKKKAAAPTSAPTSVPIEGTGAVAEGVDGTVGADGVKIENGTETTPANNEDTEMGEGSMVASDDDEDGDDGDEGEDEEGSVDNQNSPSKPPRPTSPVPLAATGIKTVPSLGFSDTPMSNLEFPRPHPIIQTERMKSEGQSGSPLKNVALATSALTSPLESPTVAPPFSDIGVSVPQQDSVVTAVEKEYLDEEMLLETAESAPTELPQPPPEPTATEVAASVEVLREEEEEEEMLLDIVENASNAQIGESEVPIAAPEIHAEQVPIPPIEAPVEPIHSEVVEAPKETEPEPVDPVLLENAEPVTIPEVQNTEDEDDFPDLLGGLEKSLEKPEQAPTSLKATEFEEKAETAEPPAIEVSESASATEAEKKEEA